MDLNTIIADHYDELGEQRVRANFFTEKDPVHTNEAGAKFNVTCVLEGLKKLPVNSLGNYMLP